MSEKRRTRPRPEITRDPGTLSTLYVHARSSLIQIIGNGKIFDTQSDLMLDVIDRATPRTLELEGYFAIR